MVGLSLSGIGIRTDVEGSVDGLILGTHLILASKGLREMVNNFSVAIPGQRFDHDAS